MYTMKRHAICLIIIYTYVYTISIIDLCMQHHLKLLNFAKIYATYIHMYSYRIMDVAEFDKIFDSQFPFFTVVCMVNSVAKISTLIHHYFPIIHIQVWQWICTLNYHINIKWLLLWVHNNFQVPDVKYFVEHTALSGDATSC